MNNKPPYDVAQDANRPFLAFETSAVVVLLPWHALRGMYLASDGSSLVFEYGNASVEVLGAGLSVLAELAASARLKSVRQGETDDTQIISLRLLGGES